MKNFSRKSKNSARFVVLAIFAFIFFANFQTARAATFVSGEISTDTVWTKEESPYVVEDYLEVEEGVTLTIDPGVIVKFNQSYIDIYGKIVASGTATEKIYFTSFLDDSAGGDTNNDGTATLPDDGDWHGINFYKPSSGSEFEYLDSKYAETNFYLDSSDLKLASSTVSFADDAVIDSNDSDLSVLGSKFENYYYGIDTAGGTLILANNSFNQGQLPVYADYETEIKNFGNTVAGNEYNGIGLYGGSYHFNFHKVFYKDIPYIIFNDLDINSSSTAVFEPGSVIKAEGWLVGVNVYGKLTAIGKDDDKIIFTAINDDSVYGDTDSDGGIYLPRMNSWDGIYFAQSSSESDLENFVIKYSDGIYFDSIDIDLDKIFFENCSSLDIYNGNLKINNSFFKNNNKGVDTYEGNAEIANTIFQNNRYSIDVFYGNAKVDDSIIEDSHDGVYIHSGDLKINNSIIKNNDFNIIASQAYLDLKNSSVSGGVIGSGISAWEAKEVNIIGNRINDNNRDGISLESASTTISGNYIFGNHRNGINKETSAPATISGNDIYNNIGFGINNKFGISVPMSAKNNWWGDASGPYHPTLNPQGKGDEVSGGVVFDPWLTASIEKPAGFSSVAFIPGIQASRLYKEGLLFENQLWEPNRNDDVRKLFMDASGKSIDAGIYTRDIIKETNTPVYTGNLGLNVYKKFSESMDKLVASSTISAWKALPYDWRFDLSDIVGGGVEGSGGNISFINQEPYGQLPYMILELEKLAENSKNGKVTIITHSNGGLVAKALLKKLAEMKAGGESDLIDKIDRLIMVAAPELGTPQAIASMLHGDGQELGFGWILNGAVARELAENMLGAYNLLPSEKYFNTVLDPMIKFDPSLDKLNSWRTVYGDAINSYGEMQDFILGKEGRAKPSSGNTDAPNVLSASLRALAENNHRDLDDWQIPASIEVAQIAGWGLDTVSGVEYYTQFECAPNPQRPDVCIPQYVLGRNPMFTSEGDETVVAPSATSAVGKTYYLDIGKYNEAFKDNSSHAYIFEIQPLEDLLKNIITENSTTTLPDHITTEKPEPTGKKLRLSVHSPVSIDVYDNLGNHTGLIPNPGPNSDLELVEENISNSYYMNFGEGKYVGFSSGGQNKVELNGTGSGTFTLKVGEYFGDEEATSTVFVDIPVTSAIKGELNIENLDTLPQLKIDVEGDGTFDFEIKPSGQFDPILFLEIMKKTILTFSLKKGEEESLINRIDNLIKSIKKGKIKQAGEKMKGFIRNFESKNKHNKKIGEEEKQVILNMLNNLLNNF